MSELFRDLKKMYVLLLAILLIGLILPLLVPNQARAATFVERALSLSSNAPAATSVQYTLDIKMPTPVTNTSLGSIEILFCTTPLRGSCTGPDGGSAGFSVTSATVVSASKNGSGITFPVMGSSGNAPSNAGTSINSNLASSTTNARTIRVVWATAQTVAAGDEISLVLGGITNPTATNTFFARVATYTTAGAASVSITGANVDDGTVANSIQAVQNVSFKVQETLSFCAGTMANGTVAHTGFAAATITNACAQSAGTNISLGIAPDSTTVCRTPVAVRDATCDDTGTTNDNNYGYLMISTNAVNGAIVGYRPNSATNYTQGTLQLASASCSFPSQTDSCIDPVNGNTPGTPTAMPSTATTEAFGMAVPTRSTTGKATTNLTINTSTTGFHYTGTTGSCTAGTNTTNCWNWNRTGTGTLASSVYPNGAIDNEALQVMFAVKSAVTTPSGQYQVNVDYFSVPTY